MKTEAAETKTEHTPSVAIFVRSKRTGWSYLPCGCRKCSQRFEACLLHAAALDMLEALQARKAYRLRQPTPWGHPCQWCGPCMAKVEEMEEAAIEKATA